jgi:hypothetical protein
VPTSVVDAAPTLAPLTSRRRNWTSSAAAVSIAAVLLAVPLVVAVVSLLGSHWRPASDVALEALRIKDVGGNHTPLVGVQSRLGWHHPGPLMFWLLAPFSWLFGNTGILAGTAILNGAAVVGSLLVARRRGGLPMLAFVAVVAALLTHALGPETLIDPWNPWIPVLPFLLYLLLAWSAAEQDWVALPWLVGIGSFLMQTHVGYAPVVLGLGVLSCTLGAYRWKSGRGRSQVEDGAAVATRTRVSARRWILIAGVVVLVWLAPVVQQVTGSPGNLGEIVDSFRYPTDPVAGWDTGFGVMGNELGFVGPWITGTDADPSGLVGTSSTIPGILLILATAALGALAWRRGAKDAGRLAVLAVAGAGLGVVAVSRITGFLGPYLVRWSWILAALVWLSIAWSLWSLLARAIMVKALVTVSLVAVLGLVASTGWSAASVHVPGQQFSDAISRLGPRAASRLQPDQRYLLTFVDSENFGAPVGSGVFLDLEERGQQVRVQPLLSQPFGSWRTARRSQVDADVFVVAGGDIERGWIPPQGARRIAKYDPLSPQERARSQYLETQIRERLGTAAPVHALGVLSPIGRQQLVANGASPRQVNELWHLHEQGDSYSVYVAPAS